ncbi:MAG: SPOR domain-containing protein, partial [Desulfobacterales bacterium]|nr:SPOR domain-containing protein [Desulfobacterales bacterium]
IDDAFWKKYEAVQKDRECRIVECLGRTAVAKTSKAADLDKKVLGKKTQAPKPSSPPKSTKSAGLKQDSWILAQNPKHFTLQIAAFGSEQASKEFIHKQPQPERFACYRLKSKGKALYAVIYGIFSKRSDADKAATSHFGKPWVRDFKSIQEIIKKQ